MNTDKKNNLPARTTLFSGQTKDIIATPRNGASKQEVSAFIASIVKYTRSLFKKEIEDWQNARAYALNVTNPRRYYLYQVYRDVELDMFIKGQVNQRVHRIKNKKFKIIKADGTKDVEKTKLLQTKWFKEYLKYRIETKFWGYTLVYFLLDENGKLQCRKVYRENVVPEQSLIVKTPFDPEGALYTEEPFASYCVGLGDCEDLGLYESLAWGFILKKHSWQSWDEFEEMFGVPIRIAKTASQDKAAQLEIVNWLEDMGHANHALFPIDTELDVIESKQKDAFGVFLEKIKQINTEAAILINGQNESAQDKGSRGKSETIMSNTQDQISEDDKGDVVDDVNDKLLPLLAKTFKFPFIEGDRFEWDDELSMDTNDLADVLVKVDAMGFELDMADVAEKLGVKILGKKEPVVAPGMPPNKTTDCADCGGVGCDKCKPADTSKKKKVDNTFKSILNMHQKINELTHHDHE